MSTPEGDISGLQAGRIEPVPVYVEHEESVEAEDNSNLPTYTIHEEGQDELQAIIAILNTAVPFKRPNPDVISEIIRRQRQLIDVPDTSGVGKGCEYDVPPLDRECTKWKSEAIIVEGFFDVILKGNVDAVKLFIKNNLVTANTTLQGRTPLLAAVECRKIEMVKQLIEAGAEPDAYGVEVILDSNLLLNIGADSS
jgi:Ankyrin repeat